MTANSRNLVTIYIERPPSPRHSTTTYLKTTASPKFVQSNPPIVTPNNNYVYILNTNLTLQQFHGIVHGSRLAQQITAEEYQNLWTRQ